MTEVVALVPARDETEHVGATVEALHRLAGMKRIIVADDGSADDTAAVAIDAGADVVRTARSRGKGAALEAAATLAGAMTPQVWLLVDADLGDTARGLGPLVEAVAADRADVAIGIVPSGEGGGFGLVQRAAGAAIGLLAGISVRQPLSGQRALSTAAMAHVRPFARGFGVETAMTIDAARAGLRVLEIPVDVRHRPTYRDLSGFAHRGRQGAHILAAVAARVRGRR